MQATINIAERRKSAVLFCIGWAMIMLSLMIGVRPVWDTFIHIWKVEYTASLVLLGLLAYGLYTLRGRAMEMDLPVLERNLIIFPILATVIWSGLSAFWAPSWKSAVHHSLIWSEYLIFYILVRRLIDEGRNFSLLLSTPALVLGFYAVLAVISYCTVVAVHGGIPVGMIYARYGEQINTILPLVMIGVVWQTGRRFKIGASLVALLWLLVFCSASRTSIGLFLVGAITTAGAIFFTKAFRKWRRKMAVIIIAMVAFTVPLYLFSVVASQADDTVLGNRLADQENMSGSNDFRRLMIAVSVEMISAHPLIGIGADNFGFQANNYRSAYGAKNPDNPVLAQAESEIPERAHNEYLQILAELGIVGGSLLLWLLCGIGLIVWRAIRPQRVYSPFAIAAALGLMIFLASSLVTSYSFRLIQNGFIFFFVLAVASKLAFSAKSEKECRVVVSPGWTKFAYAAAMAACIGLLTYWSIRVGSVALTTSANSTANLDQATVKYETAMWLDDENPEARYFLGLRLLNSGRYPEAAPLLKESIRIGKGRSDDYSYLVTAQFLAGDTKGAEQSLAEAATLYPRSPFILTRYAAILQANGKSEMAEAELERARQINKRAANTWWVLINHGAKAASDLAFSDEADYMKVMDLQPIMSMYAVVAERDIRFPDERAKLPFDQMGGGN